MSLLTLEEIIQLSPVFKGKCGNSIARGIMKMLSVDKINELYDRNSDRTGPDFARAVLDDIGLKYEILHQDILDSFCDSPFITVSNHPYGSLDGIILIDIFAHRFSSYKLMVNKFLSRIRALDCNFISVTPTGDERTAPSRDSILGVKAAMAHVRSGNPLGIFPAGAVSDLSLKDRCIRDRQWQEPVLRLIKKLRVPVIPVKFLDRNSDFYYSLGLIDWRIRLLRLPAEVFNKKGETVRIAIGEAITPAQQDELQDITAFGTWLREKVYCLH